VEDLPPPLLKLGEPILDTHSLVNDNEVIDLQRKYNIKSLTPLLPIGTPIQ